MKARILLLSCIAAGCATGPIAMIDGTRSFPDDPYNYDVEIIAIDGKAYLTQRPERIIDPGSHVIVLRTTKPRGIRRIGVENSLAAGAENIGKDWAEQAVLLNAESCVRYLFSAQHSTNRAQLEWEPRVREEPISGCETKNHGDSKTEPNKSQQEDGD